MKPDHIHVFVDVPQLSLIHILVLPDLKELDFRLNAYRKDKEISKSKLTRLLKSFVETKDVYKRQVWS